MSGKVEAQSPLLTAGRYRVERLIARGGMGAVYLARHIDLHREVALKILSPSPDMEESGSFEERFRLEAETLAALNHPNIVTLYDYGQTDDGRYFLALEYIDGPRFTDLLRDGALPPSDAVRLLLEVCRALRYAHKRGVVHRDLKPSNLLVWTDDEGDEHVKVVDFGLVKVMEDDQSLTRAGLILGSPHCMAPEQIRGDEIDHRADIYAMGVLLFRAVTGKWPFHGESSTATMIAHINNPIPRMADLGMGATVPPLLEDTIRRCLAKRAEDRYADVSTLMTDLRRSVGADASLTLSSGRLAALESTLGDDHSVPPPPDPALDEPTGVTHPSIHATAVTRVQAAADRPPGANGRPALLVALGAALVLLLVGGVALLNAMMGGSPPDPAVAVSTDGLSGEAPAPEAEVMPAPPPAPEAPPPAPEAAPTPAPAPKPVAKAAPAPPPPRPAAAPSPPAPEAAPAPSKGKGKAGDDGFLDWD